MLDWNQSWENKGWEPERPRETRPRPRLERQRCDLPRGKDMASRIGSELRAMFPLPQPTDELAGVRELLARLEVKSGGT